MEQRPGNASTLISTDPSVPAFSGGSWRYQPVDLVFPVRGPRRRRDGAGPAGDGPAAVGSGFGSSVSMDKAVMKALYPNGRPWGLSPNLPLEEERRQGC